LEVPKGTETPPWKFYHKRKGKFNILGDKGNKLILMTKDHIIPLSKQGEDNLNNLQTMCIVCNNKKSNNLPNNKSV
jgi:5-methylcytosine-specific restriction endonuclease McrA